MISRRAALFGLLAGPAIIRTPGLLMPIKPIHVELWIVDPVEWLHREMQKSLVDLISGTPLRYDPDGFAAISRACDQAIWSLP